TLSIWYDPAADAPTILDEEQSLIDHITSKINDVYTRIQSQRRVARLTYLYQLLIETNLVIAHSQNRQDLLTELQQVLLNLGRFATILIAIKAEDRADSPLMIQFLHNSSANIMPT